MKNYRVYAFTGILAAGSVMLSACASQASTPVTVAPGLSGEVRMERPADPADRITVNSSETVKVTPDMAEITYGVSTEEADAVACQQKNTESVNAVVEYLKGMGFEEKSIKTSGFSLSPRYDWSGDKQTLIGFSMRAQITLSDVPLDQVGSLLSSVVSSGANEIQSVVYLSGKYDEIYQEALAKAVELAKTKAQALAAAGGREIGEIVSIEEYGDNQYGRYLDSGVNMEQAMTKGMTSAASAAMDMSVMPGEMEVKAQLRVEFAMKPVIGA